MATTPQLLQSARAHIEAGRFDEARAIYQAFDRSQPRSAEVALLFSQLAFEEGDTKGCLSHLRIALDRAPNNVRLWQNAADRFRHFHKVEEALDAYDRAIALDPKALKPRANKAHYLQILGRFQPAEKAFRKLIKAAPKETELYRMAMPTLQLKPADPIRRQMKALWAETGQNDFARMHLGYALAEAEPDPARKFRYLEQANALQNKAAPFDPDAIDREYKGVLQAQCGALPKGPEGAAPNPIFVVGVPRSGTTLVEQILGAHSAVTAGGEMPHGLATAYGQFGAGEKMKTPQSAEAVTQFALRYKRLLHRDTLAETPFVTDKSITTHLIIGLLHAAMPKAAFVVVMRDPRDIALSIYRNYFELGTHRYAAKLENIALFIKAFRRNIAHWQARCPGLIHVVRYEDLVSDPEAETKALVQAVGLEWEEACLSFHRQKSSVQTLSLAQVRQPIHAGRKQAWRAYETQLQPFIEAWGDEPWD